MGNRILCRILCAAAVCLVTLSGCSGGQEKTEPVESERLLEQSETEPEQSKQPSDQPETQEQAEDDESEKAIEELADFSTAFHDIKGCAVIYDPSENKYSIYNKDMAVQEASPYSTFKIISTLAGLHNHIIEDETSLMKYNGTGYQNPEWNGDLTLEQAFQTSCIWYFRQIIDGVGKAEIEAELGKLEYGNQDISEWEGSNLNPYEELNGFWLSSSLKISPMGQVEILSNIFDGDSIYSNTEIETLKKIMLVQDNGASQVYGKTGSGSNGEAWFVGFIETEGQRTYFSVYLNDSSRAEEISGNVAKEIALKIIAAGSK